MYENLFAYTRPTGQFPGYLSINRLENGDIAVTVREAPTEREGVHVCMHTAGPGNCTPGGPTCNNYCNMAPEKDPMQDHPLPWTHVEEGRSATFTIPAGEWPKAWVIDSRTAVEVDAFAAARFGAADETVTVTKGFLREVSAQMAESEAAKYGLTSIELIQDLCDRGRPRV